MIPIGSENEKFAESYLKCKHVENLPTPYRLDFDNTSHIILYVKNEMIQKKWTTASNRHRYRDNQTKENIGFVSSIWSPIVYEILLNVYLKSADYKGGRRLWYLSLENEELIDDERIDEFEELTDPVDQHRFILERVDQFIYDTEEAWTVDFLFKTFSR